MSEATDLYARIDAAVERHRDALRDLALRIHAHPELRFDEKHASTWVAETVERAAGVSVERGVGGLATALRAKAGTKGPRVAILAEYDALPEIGHACGHNLIAAGAVGAFLALAGEVGALGGSVELVGTPAEEGGGGKITLLEAGVFEGVDAAMMFHPFDRDVLAHAALANVWLEFEFKGTPSHAAIAPWDGSSALTACMQTFYLVDSQRVHFRDGVRVHGFVTDGGQAVNIIPERAACEFSVRATTGAELDRVRAIVERCARGAAMAAGVELSVRSRRGYRDMRNNLPLARAFGRHMSRLGRQPREHDPRVGAGSTDMGDVSHAVPAIHPWVGICDEGVAQCHQRAFAACAASDRGVDSMLVAAKAMASSAADVIRDAALRDDSRKAFERPSE
jgi:amidohydrolase